MRIGGTASTTSAISTTVNPTRRKTSPIAITARVGSARPMFETLIATNESRRRWPSPTPIGSAMRERDPDRGAGEPRCSTVLSREESGVVADEPERVDEHGERCGDHRRLRDPRPRRQRPLDEHEERVRDEGEADRERGRDDQLRVEELAQREEDRPPEPLGNHERCDGRERDRRDGRDAEPGHDRRQRERELDPPQDLQRLIPMPRAASSTSWGTARRPARMFRKRISSV